MTESPQIQLTVNNDHDTAFISTISAAKRASLNRTGITQFRINVSCLNMHHVQIYSLLHASVFKDQDVSTHYLLRCHSSSLFRFVHQTVQA